MSTTPNAPKSFFRMTFEEKAQALAAVIMSGRTAHYASYSEADADKMFKRVDEILDQQGYKRE